jgi:hypothetical protein
MSPDEEERVERWHAECFVNLGFNGSQVVTLLNWGVDPHEAARLTERGCPHETAMRILVPLDAAYVAPLELVRSF